MSAAPEQALARALADELDLLAEAMAELGTALMGDVEMLRRHMVGLQAIDRVTQTQLAIAALLRSDAPVGERIAGVMLEDLADRLLLRVARPDVPAPIEA